MTEIRWWWVRHAPTGARGAIGWHDLPADLGDTQRLDALQARLPIAPVISSDLRRARATADRIAGDRPRLPDEPAFRELNFGAWEGLTFDVIAERFPADNQQWLDEQGPARATDGESFDDLSARVAAAVSRRHGQTAVPLDGQDIIVVGHMGSILAALRHATGMTARQVLGFKIDTLSVTRLDWIPEAKAWRVVHVNAAFAAI